MAENKRFRKLLIWMLVANGLILVGAGHGLICMEMLAVLFPFFIVGQNAGSVTAQESPLNFLSPTRFDESLFLLGLLVFFGQGMLITGLCMKKTPCSEDRH